MCESVCVQIAGYIISFIMDCSYIKGGQIILFLFKTYAKAITTAYPELTFDHSKLSMSHTSPLLVCGMC